MAWRCRQASKQACSESQFHEELLRELFLGGMAHVNPETGHITERFWLAMWDPENYGSWHDGDVAMEKRNKHGAASEGEVAWYADVGGC